MRYFYLFIILCCFSCDNHEVKDNKIKEHNKIPIVTKIEPTKIEKPVKTQSIARVQVYGDLSSSAKAVLKAAFESDYRSEEDKVNAYDFPLYEGNKGMDWWNFPWDLPSSYNTLYTLSYNDMKAILENVKVKSAKNSDKFVSYAEMLKSLVFKLNSTIMNAHGGYARVLKIIYCVRNFLAVALKYKLSKDVIDLKLAAQKIIAIYESGELMSGDSPYTKESSFAPKNVDGELEDRSAEAGIEDLKLLLLKN
jgi:hypothetical protein